MQNQNGACRSPHSISRRERVMTSVGFYCGNIERHNQETLTATFLQRLCKCKACVLYFWCLGRQFEPKRTQIVIDFNSINKFGKPKNITEWKNGDVGPCWLWKWNWWSGVSFLIFITLGRKSLKRLFPYFFLKPLFNQQVDFLGGGWVHRPGSSGCFYVHLQWLCVLLFKRFLHLEGNIFRLSCNIGLRVECLKMCKYGNKIRTCWPFYTSVCLQTQATHMNATRM